MGKIGPEKIKSAISAIAENIKIEVQRAFLGQIGKEIAQKIAETVLDHFSDFIEDEIDDIEEENTEIEEKDLRRFVEEEIMRVIDDMFDEEMLSYHDMWEDISDVICDKMQKIAENVIRRWFGGS